MIKKREEKAVGGTISDSFMLEILRSMYPWGSKWKYLSHCLNRSMVQKIHFLRDADVNINWVLVVNKNLFMEAAQ